MPGGVEREWGGCEYRGIESRLERGQVNKGQQRVRERKGLEKGGVSAKRKRRKETGCVQNRLGEGNL